MKKAVPAVGVLAFALCATTPSFAQVVDSCGGGCPKPPSNTRAVSSGNSASSVGFRLAAYPGNVLSVTLVKGKAKRILYAEGMLSDAPSGPVGLARAYALRISVNGLPMQPNNPQIFNVIDDCGTFSGANPDGYCMVTGHWWLDMDDPANAALLGVPITVSLVGGDYLEGQAVGTFVDMSLRVRLEKK